MKTNSYAPLSSSRNYPPPPQAKYLTHLPLTKWLPFPRRHVQIHLHLIRISLKCVPNDSINNIPALVQINGLAPIRPHAIICTNADTVHWRKNTALGGDEVMRGCDFHIRAHKASGWGLTIPEMNIVDCYGTKVQYMLIHCDQVEPISSGLRGLGQHWFR